MKNPVSIVIPAYNEEHGVSKQISSIQKIMDKTNWDYDLILVDDGSTDLTFDEIKKHKDVKVIRLPENRGYGAALKEGISNSENELIVITDADGTYPADAIPELLDKSDGYDMIVGARITDGVKLPWQRIPAKWVLRKLASYLAGKKIPDLNSGLRVMKKSVIERFFHVLPSGFSFTSTISLCLLCNDYLVHYHPISYAKRIGKSKIRPIDTYYFFLLILRTIILFNPLKVFLPFGAVFFLLGLIKLFFVDIPIRNLSETTVLGFLAAFIIWAIGLLSDQIARIGLARR
jgi:glycosyltransferase involved in cell wall biosynthesis